MEDADNQGLKVLTAEKSRTLVALADAKYDKIVHVRQAANKAIGQMEKVPDAHAGRSGAAVQPETSDLDMAPSLLGEAEEAPAPKRCCPLTILELLAIVQ